MQRFQPLEKDYYLEEEYYYDGRDRMDSDSSDDEVQKAMAKIARVPVRHCSRTEEKSVSDFESDVDEELSVAFKQHTTALLNISPSPQPTSAVVKKQPQEETQTDPALGLGDKKTDSDDDFMAEEGLTGKNDMDLFYDPQEDQDNEQWVKEHRASLSGQQPQKATGSDAVLNCPACMTLLCLDCQRHSVYKTQYRAMFVQNCQLVSDHVLYMPSDKRKTGKRNKRKGAEPKPKDRLEPGSVPKDCDPSDLFKSVQCNVCKSEVGVMDSDDVYHFFNVLSSYT